MLEEAAQQALKRGTEEAPARRTVQGGRICRAIAHHGPVLDEDGAVRGRRCGTVWLAPLGKRGNARMAHVVDELARSMAQAVLQSAGMWGAGDRERVRKVAQAMAQAARPCIRAWRTAGAGRAGTGLVERMWPEDDDAEVRNGAWDGQAAGRRIEVLGQAAEGGPPPAWLLRGAALGRHGAGRGIAAAWQRLRHEEQTRSYGEGLAHWQRKIEREQGQRTLAQARERVLQRAMRRRKPRTGERWLGVQVLAEHHGLRLRTGTEVAAALAATCMEARAVHRARSWRSQVERRMQAKAWPGAQTWRKLLHEAMQRAGAKPGREHEALDAVRTRCAEAGIEWAGPSLDEEGMEQEWLLGEPMPGVQPGWTFAVAGEHRYAEQTPFALWNGSSDTVALRLLAMGTGASPEWTKARNVQWAESLADGMPGRWGPTGQHSREVPRDPELQRALDAMPRGWLEATIAGAERPRHTGKA